jgi:prepilin-type N-terminal cleavage/methylation domain-containing protein/prepilin-type processing-associated H-X9-DG protein
VKTHDTRRGPQRVTPARSGRGFTLLELLVVVAIIGLVASMLLPSMVRSRSRAQAIFCLRNLQQVHAAWTMYADDNYGRLPGVISGSYPGSDRWVSGWLDFSSSTDNTNTLYLTEVAYSQLAPYIRDAAVYRCPSDRSEVTINGRSHARVRSLSMNCWMNYIGTAPIGQDQFQVFRRLDDILDFPLDKAWVLMDEREDSINDGLFQTNLKLRGVQARIVDYPASYHGRSAGVVFADGHAEIKRWKDQRTTPPLRSRHHLELDVPSPDNPDVAWLQEHSSSPRTAPE